MPVLAGFHDADLHPQVIEAVKVLEVVQGDYLRKTQGIDGQYLKALEASHDGDTDSCLSIKAQVHAVRELF